LLEALGDAEDTPSWRLGSVPLMGWWPCAVSHNAVRQEGVEIPSEETTAKAAAPRQRMVTHLPAPGTLPGAEIPLLGEERGVQGARLPGTAGSCEAETCTQCNRPGQGPAVPESQAARVDTSWIGTSASGRGRAIPEGTN